MTKLISPAQQQPGALEVPTDAGGTGNVRPRLSAKREAELLLKEHFGIDQKLKACNSMPFINRARVRNFLLEHAKATRPHNKFNRVSEETLREIHENVRQMLIARVHRTPSKGRTM